MNDLQKDQAIYNEMLKIANQVFSNAAENNEELRKYINENGGVVSINEITKARSEVSSMIEEATNYDYYTGEGEQTVTVDTFTCSFPPMRVFELVKYWKSLAKAKGEIIFTYQEEINRQYIGSVDIRLGNPTNASALIRHLADQVHRPILSYVLLEVNTKSCDVNFVASDGRSMGILSSNVDGIREDAYPENKYQALFSSSDWKRICDYARKYKTAVHVKIYKHSDTEKQDTMVASLGETSVRSKQEDTKFYNWHCLLPDTSSMTLFQIHPDDVKAARNFVKSIKKAKYNEKDICLTFQKGSDKVQFTHIDREYDEVIEERSATFRLLRRAEQTRQVCYTAEELKRTKFTGFYIDDTDKRRVTIVNDENTSITLLMPCAEIYDRYLLKEEIQTVMEMQVA